MTPKPAIRAVRPRASLSAEAVTVPTPSSPTRPWTVPVQISPRAAASAGLVRSKSFQDLPPLGYGPALGRDRVGNLHGLVADLHLGEGVALAVDELVLGQGDLGRAVDDVVHDGGHLEHVLAGGVDQRVVGVHLHARDG